MMGDNVGAVDIYMQILMFPNQMGNKLGGDKNLVMEISAVDYVACDLLADTAIIIIFYYLLL